MLPDGTIIKAGDRVAYHQVRGGWRGDGRREKEGHEGTRRDKAGQGRTRRDKEGPGP
jgi:hypothetical protein